MAEALKESAALIVICSEHGAASAWVAEEIRRFKAMHGDRRVFAVLADSCAEAQPTSAMPLPLKRRVLADGSVTSEPDEPLAITLVGPGGRAAALRRLAAGLLGVNLDALVQRDSARRHRHLMRVAAVLVMALIGTALLARSAIEARDEARAQRGEAEQLISFMLGDLKEQAEKSGRLDMLDAVAAQALSYYRRLELSDLGADSLARRSQALHLIGETRMARGDFPAAERAFADARATTDELLKRAPDDLQRIFDHAQSVFWEGNLALTRHELAAAQRAFEAYAQLANRLVEIDPANKSWRQESGWSQQNLCAVYIRQRRAEDAVSAGRSAVETFRDLGRGAAATSAEMDNLAQALAWYATAERLLGRLDAAASARDGIRRIYEARIAADPFDLQAQSALATSRFTEAEIALDRSDSGAAASINAAAVQLMERLSAAEPANLDWKVALGTLLRQRAEVLVEIGQPASALTSAARAPDIMRLVRDRNPDEPTALPELIYAEAIGADAARSMGDEDTARRLAANALQLANAASDASMRPRLQLRALFAADPISREAITAAAQALPKEAGTRTLEMECMLVAAARFGGDVSGTTAAAAHLRESGYRRSPCGDTVTLAMKSLGGGPGAEGDLR